MSEDIDCLSPLTAPRDTSCTPSRDRSGSALMRCRGENEPRSLTSGSQTSQCVIATLLTGCCRRQWLVFALLKPFCQSKWRFWDLKRDSKWRRGIRMGDNHPELRAASLTGVFPPLGGEHVQDPHSGRCLSVKAARFGA